MKKQIITLTIILGMAMTGFAQDGMFHRANSGDNGNAVYESKSGMFRETTTTLTPGLPFHGESGNQDAPLGSGIVMLLSLGAAYAVAKKRNEE